VKYMLLLYTPDHELTDAEYAGLQPAFMAYTQMLAESGKLVAGDALAEVSTATTVRVRDGKRLITDGPYAETKEYLGGYYVIDCATLDEALDLTAQCPGAIFGQVEVRPLMDMAAAQHAG
jgi:hypothetical protein